MREAAPERDSGDDNDPRDYGDQDSVFGHRLAPVIAQALEQREKNFRHALLSACGHLSMSTKLAAVSTTTNKRPAALALCAYLLAPRWDAKRRCDHSRPPAVPDIRRRPTRRPVTIDGCSPCVSAWVTRRHGSLGILKPALPAPSCRTLSPLADVR
jgi:hypothetical protein